MRTTRRQFIRHTAAASLAATAGVSVSHSALALSHTIRRAVRRDETILRLGGNGDDFPMTWAADDRQWVAVQDGIGWSNNPKGEYNSRLWTVSGGPHEATFEDVTGYPELLNVLHSRDSSRYYGFGTLAVDDRLYQYLATPTGPNGSKDMTWCGAKLIYSPDRGRTWHNQDGSTPVVWETWEQRSRANMVFFNEPQHAFSLPAILQMGRNYEANRDGYVYVYSPNGTTVETLNQLVLFRVPKARILQRDAYEYFAGLHRDGSARWSRQMTARAPVHVFPPGWVSRGAFVVESWYPSVVYNAPLDLYMMASWGAGCSPEGVFFTQPSYLGLWVAPRPWGPWRQILEETAWTPGGDPKARCYAPQIAPKWIAPDGRSFWLVWTDYQYTTTDACKKAVAEWGDALRPDPRLQGRRDEEDRQLLLATRPCQPYYAFNTQRVDLLT